MTPKSFRDASEEIISAGQFLDRNGWAPATSGNYSVRLNETEVAMTVSGRHKGRLLAEDILKVDYDARPLTPQVPSAEALLHTLLYKLDPNIAAVLHTHSVNSTVITRLLKNDRYLRLEGYELLKAFPGITTHEACIYIPIFENSQDMGFLSREVERELAASGHRSGFLIRGHGLYTWGESMQKARHTMEAMEFLMECEMKTFSLTR